MLPSTQKPSPSIQPQDGTIALDLSRAEQLRLTSESIAQKKAIDSTRVIAFATSRAARVTWGKSPRASLKAGSITIPAGTSFLIVKEASDKIAARAADGIPGGAIDLIPIKNG